MANNRDSERPATVLKKRSFPPGRIKIAKALTALLQVKEFNAITMAEIAKKAGVTEPLIYKYFKDKRDLLYQVIAEHAEVYLSQAELDIRGIKGALNKIRKMIWSYINVYAMDRVFAKIILLDVRSFLDFYQSDAYKIVRKYSSILLHRVEEGIAEGEIRDDLSPQFIRQVIMGSVENVCLACVVFNRDINPDDLTEDLCKFIFRGIEREISSDVLVETFRDFISRSTERKSGRSLQKGNMPVKQPGKSARRIRGSGRR